MDNKTNNLSVTGEKCTLSRNMGHCRTRMRNMMMPKPHCELQSRWTNFGPNGDGPEQKGSDNIKNRKEEAVLGLEK